MIILRTLMAVVLLLLSSRLTLAQTVQLPTFRFFTVDTSVMVPDRGATYLGGNSRSSEMSIWRRGLPYFGANRGLGKETSHGGINITATIHDFEAMERELLGPEYDSIMNPPSRNSTNPSGRYSAKSGSADNMSLSSIRQKHSQQLMAKNREAEKFEAHAEKALASGKSSVAKLFFQSAIDEAQGEYRQYLVLRLNQLNQSQQTSAN